MTEPLMIARAGSVQRCSAMFGQANLRKRVAESRSGVTPHTVTLANGATVHALVGIVNPGFIPPSQCHPVTAAGLRVYPPNQTQSKVVPYPFTACSLSGPVYLTVGPVGFP